MYTPITYIYTTTTPTTPTTTHTCEQVQTCTRPSCRGGAG